MAADNDERSFLLCECTVTIDVNDKCHRACWRERTDFKPRHQKGIFCGIIDHREGSFIVGHAALTTGKITVVYF